MKKTTLKHAFPTYGDIATMVAIFFVSQIILGIILQCVGVVPPVLSDIDAVDVETYMNEQIALGEYTALVYPLTMLFSIILLRLYIRFRGGKRAIHINHAASGFNPSVLLVGVLWLLSSQIILEPLMTMLPQSQGPGIGRGVWACITAVGSAAVLEEILCRGLIFETLHKRWGIKRSIFISSLFFGMIHFDPATAIIAVIAGMIFGVMYVRTSSLFATIIVHAINNAVAYAMLCFGIGDVTFKEIIGGGVVYYVLYGVAVVIFVAAFVEAYFKLKKIAANG